MDVLCPECRNVMVYQSDRIFRCENCAKSYRQSAYCPECHKPLQKLQGCGATDYLCQNGHGLVSKKRVVFEYEKQ